MIGVVYLLLALSCWTVWAVLSARMGARLSPLNTLLWTGFVSALITAGGFAVHHRQLRLPSGNEWWLMALFCAANTAACLGYYGALRHLPGGLVLPVSHLYLVLGPVFIAFLERRAMSWQQFGALALVMIGLCWFLAATPSSSPNREPQIESSTFILPTPARQASLRALTPAIGFPRPSARICARDHGLLVAQNPGARRLVARLARQSPAVPSEEAV